MTHSFSLGYVIFDWCYDHALSPKLTLCCMPKPVKCSSRNCSSVSSRCIRHRTLWDNPTAYTFGSQDIPSLEASDWFSMLLLNLRQASLFVFRSSLLYIFVFLLSAACVIRKLFFTLFHWFLKSSKLLGELSASFWFCIFFCSFVFQWFSLVFLLGQTCWRRRFCILDSLAGGVGMISSMTDATSSPIFSLSIDPSS